MIGSLENYKKNGVCIKCYRSVERVVKLQNEVPSLTDKMNESIERVSLSLSFPRRSVSEKRLLKSPDSLLSTKFLRCPTAVSTVVPVKTERFCDFTQPRPLVMLCNVTWHMHSKDMSAKLD